MHIRMTAEWALNAALEWRDSPGLEIVEALMLQSD
jgi:hypothetical protein